MKHFLFQKPAAFALTSERRLAYFAAAEGPTSEQKKLDEALKAAKEDKNGAEVKNVMENRVRDFLKTDGEIDVKEMATLRASAQQALDTYFVGKGKNHDEVTALKNAFPDNEQKFIDLSVKNGFLPEEEVRSLIRVGSIEKGKKTAAPAGAPAADDFPNPAGTEDLSRLTPDQLIAELELNDDILRQTEAQRVAVVRQFGKDRRRMMTELNLIPGRREAFERRKHLVAAFKQATGTSYSEYRSQLRRSAPSYVPRTTESDTLPEARFRSPRKYAANPSDEQANRNALKRKLFGDDIPQFRSESDIRFEADRLKYQAQGRIDEENSTTNYTVLKPKRPPSRANSATGAYDQTVQQGLRANNYNPEVQSNLQDFYASRIPGELSQFAYLGQSTNPEIRTRYYQILEAYSANYRKNVPFEKGAKNKRAETAYLLMHAKTELENLRQREQFAQANETVKGNTLASRTIPMRGGAVGESTISVFLGNEPKPRLIFNDPRNWSSGPLYSASQADEAVDAGIKYQRIYSVVNRTDGGKNVRALQIDFTKPGTYTIKGKTVGVDGTETIVVGDTGETSSPISAEISPDKDFKDLMELSIDLTYPDRKQVIEQGKFYLIKEKLQSHKENLLARMRKEKNTEWDSYARQFKIDFDRANKNFVENDSLRFDGTGANVYNLKKLLNVVLEAKKTVEKRNLPTLDASAPKAVPSAEVKPSTPPAKPEKPAESYDAGLPTMDDWAKSVTETTESDPVTKTIERKKELMYSGAELFKREKDLDKRMQIAQRVLDLGLRVPANIAQTFYDGLSVDMNKTTDTSKYEKITLLIAQFTVDIGKKPPAGETFKAAFVEAAKKEGKQEVANLVKQGLDATRNASTLQEKMDYAKIVVDYLEEPTEAKVADDFAAVLELEMKKIPAGIVPPNELVMLIQKFKEYSQKKKGTSAEKSESSDASEAPAEPTAENAAPTSDTMESLQQLAKQTEKKMGFSYVSIEIDETTGIPATLKQLEEISTSLSPEFRGKMVINITGSVQDDVDISYEDGKFYVKINPKFSEKMSASFVALQAMAPFRETEIKRVAVECKNPTVDIAPVSAALLKVAQDPLYKTILGRMHVAVNDTFAKNMGAKVSLINPAVIDIISLSLNPKATEQDIRASLKQGIEELAVEVKGYDDGKEKTELMEFIKKFREAEKKSGSSETTPSFDEIEKNIDDLSK